MSPPAVARSLAAVVCANPAGLPKPDKPAAEKAARPFSQTPALINARQTAKADNVAVSEPKRSLPARNKSGCIAPPLSESASTADLSSARGRKTTGVSGKAQGLEALMQAAGSAVQICPPPARPGSRQGPAASAKTGSTLQDATVSSARQIAGESGKAVLGEAVRGARNGLVPEKDSAAVKEHAGQLKQIETNAAVEPQGKSGVQRLAEPLKSPGARIERPLQANPERMEVENGKAFAEAPHNSSRGRPSQGAFGDGAQARAAAGGTILSTEGKEVNRPPSGDSLMTSPGSGVSEAGKPVVFSRLVSDQTSTAGGFEGPAGKGPAQSVSEQIRDSVHASLDRGERQVVIRLRPPELGSVLVRFREQNDQIHGVLEVSRSETRHEVEQALPQVLRGLQDLGIQVRKFEVTDSELSEKDPGRQQYHQDAWPQQQGSDRQANQPQPSDFEFRISDSEFPAAIGVPAGRIDMLA